MGVVHTLTICEYDKLYVRQHRNLQKKIISEKDAAYLQQIIIDNSPIFTFGNRCLVATKWVGVVALPDFTIEILPKIFDETSVEKSRDVLVRMLLVSHLSTNIRQMPASLAMKKHSLMEMLIETFLDKLQTYVDSGLQHDYKKVSQNIKKVKGKILFNQHINKNAWNPTHFYCRYSSYQEDNELNQFFKTCLLCMADATNDAQNRKKIDELLPAFHYVSTLSREEALALNIEFTPINIRAEEPHKYGNMFLENIYATLNAGDTKIYSMLFDMNLLYETFIYRAALTALGNRVTYQRKAGYVVSRNADEKKFICMRPDLTIKTDSGEEIIVDTKWKVPNKFAKESDVYQMNAYSTSSSRVSKVILLYPHLDSTEKFVGNYTFLIGKDHARTLEIKTIDITKVLSWNNFLKELKNTIN
ncbi:MAG: hypothetical protein IJN37_00270 [Clostridia bacterium]|nr:hypothetical protein [Clostridia bacterium]